VFNGMRTSKIGAFVGESSRGLTVMGVERDDRRAPCVRCPRCARGDARRLLVEDLDAASSERERAGVLDLPCYRLIVGDAGCSVDLRK
jgi:hypothetical protein